MDLLNESYTYLIIFITIAVSILVGIFWIPYIIFILQDKCHGITSNVNVGLASNSTSSPCVPPIEGAASVADAFAIAFASLFSVPTRFRANSAAAVTLVTIEFAVGKLAVAGLTALLVIKVSRVPNNIVLSKVILVSKPHNFWVLTLRVGMLHRQTMSGCNIRLTVVKRDSTGTNYRDYNCMFESSRHSTGYLVLAGQPIDFRHVIDETSPLCGLDLDGAKLRAMKQSIMAFIVSVHGFDDTTGRSLGIERRYTFDKLNKTGGYVMLKERGYFADVVLRLSSAQVRRTGAKHSLALQWPNFNTIKERSKGKKRKVVKRSESLQEVPLPSSHLSLNRKEDIESKEPKEIARLIIELQKELYGSTDVNGNAVDLKTLQLMQGKKTGSTKDEDNELMEMLQRSKHIDEVHERWAREHPSLAMNKYLTLQSKATAKNKHSSTQGTRGTSSPYLLELEHQDQGDEGNSNT